jgi:5-methylcytosine-specific restriction enzyme A
MSNRRRPGLFNLYRGEFLRSRIWFARRDRWFAEENARGRLLHCAGCVQPATKTELELHHLDYAGVLLEQGRWTAREAHEDLVPMHPYCHELLHRLIDRDAVLSRNRTRRAASHQALQRLRLKLAPVKESSERTP